MSGWITTVERAKSRKGFHWSERSLRNLEGIHPDLRLVCDLALAITPVDFLITEGLRSQERQLELFEKGASKTMNSRHLTGHAIDFVALERGQPTYGKAIMTRVGQAFKDAGRQLRVPVVWGGDWRTFKDTPHVELSRRKYPAKEVSDG